MFKYLKLIFIKIKTKINLYISKLHTVLINKIKYIRRQAKLVTRLHCYINNVSSNKKVFIKTYYIPLISFNKNFLATLNNIYKIILLFYTTNKTTLKYRLLITIMKKKNIKINNNQIEIIFNILEIILNKNKNFIIKISIFIILNIILIIIYIYYN
jgi:hypothetical protein